MGIFTDEEHAERIRTDEEKAKSKAKPVDDRVLLTDRQIKRDVTMRALDEAVRAILAAVFAGVILSVFWIMNAYPLWVCFLIVLAATRYMW